MMVVASGPLRLYVEDGVWTSNEPDGLKLWAEELNGRGDELGDVDWRKADAAARMLHGEVLSEYPPHDDVRPARPTLLSNPYRRKLWALANPYHDESGRFTTPEGDAGGGGGVAGGNENRFYAKKMEDGRWGAWDRQSMGPARGHRIFSNKQEAERKVGQLERRFGKLRPEGERVVRVKVPKAGAAPVAVEHVDAHPGDEWANGKVLSAKAHDDNMYQANKSKVWVEVKGKGGKTEEGLLKPVKGERWKGLRDDIADVVAKEDGSQALREVLAYRVDRALGIEMTPKTSMRTTGDPVMHGSLQAKAVGAEKFLQADASRISTDDWYKLAVLDMVIGNQDRHDSNLMVKHDRPVAIDHGLAFSRSVSQPMPWPRKGLYALEHNPPMSPALKKTLLHGLEKTDWDPILKPLGEVARAAFKKRLKEVARAVRIGEVGALINSRRLRR